MSHQNMLLSLAYATIETLYMTGMATFFTILIGLPLGIFLFLTQKNQLLAHKIINQALSFIVNIGRSLPFIILMIALIPLTRFIVGTSIGSNAAIVPLSIGSIPFFARMVEGTLLTISFGLIEAALAMGANTRQIIFKVLLPEAMPGIIHSITITMVALIGYSAMAGAVGGGGLGDLAVRYGYQRFDMLLMIETIIILVILVQSIQTIGDYWAKQLKK
jgi:D-methionine transport system permease protein